MLLDVLKSNSAIQGETDRVAGTRIVDSGLYTYTINTAYLITSSGGATGLTLACVSDTGHNYNTTIYATSGTAKGGKNTYKDSNGKEQYLPGYIQLRALSLLVAKVEPEKLNVEKKVIKVYDFDAKKELPKEVNMVMDFIGQEVALGIIRQTVDVNEKNDAGEYVPSGKTRDENIVDKIFRAKDMLTVPEILAGNTEAAYKDVWVKQNANVTINRSSGGAKATGSGSVAGVPSAKPATSLFADD